MKKFTEQQLYVLRRNMVEQQIRTWDVLDERVLALYADIPRDAFVAADIRDLAYADMSAPIGGGQSMLEPKLEARMLQELAPQPGESVLHIGTGSGYFAALLSRLAGEVVSAEIRPELASVAEERIKELGKNWAGGCGNLRIVAADAALGLEKFAPYDAIVLTGSLPAAVPPQMLAQLKDGGRLMAVVGKTAPMKLQIQQKNAAPRTLLETGLPPLENIPNPANFKF